MAFIRYRQVGNNEYAYSVEAYWDSKLKKSRQRTTYLGIVVDKQKGTYRLPRKEKMANELILDFGDSFMIHETPSVSGKMTHIELNLRVRKGG